MILKQTAPNLSIFQRTSNDEIAYCSTTCDRMMHVCGGWDVRSTLCSSLKSCAPPFEPQKSSRILSGVSQRNLTIQWSFQKDCRFSSGVSLESSNGFCSGMFQRNSTFAISGAWSFAPILGQRAGDVFGQRRCGRVRGRPRPQADAEGDRARRDAFRESIRGRYLSRVVQRMSPKTTPVLI